MIRAIFFMANKTGPSCLRWSWDISKFIQQILMINYSGGNNNNISSEAKTFFWESKNLKYFRGSSKCRDNLVKWKETGRPDFNEEICLNWILLFRGKTWILEYFVKSAAVQFSRHFRLQTNDPSHGERSQVEVEIYEACLSKILEQKLKITLVFCWLK